MKNTLDCENNNQCCKKKYYLYLIESGNYFKYGITQNPARRFKQYVSHNPEVYLISLTEDIEERIRLTESAYIECLRKTGYRHIYDWFYKKTTPIGGTPIFERIMQLENERKNKGNMVLLREHLHLQDIVKFGLGFNYLRSC